uniref:Uncharacterized protein n=1 Tax=Anguilla anguilla TaxID=7936 RepID=A0A0E9STV7_ANGAN
MKVIHMYCVMGMSTTAETDQTVLGVSHTQESFADRGHGMECFV